MDQQLKENLPIFTVLILGGTLILALSGVILYQQFREVGTDLATVDQSKTERSIKKTPNPIIGSWESEHQKFGEEAKYFGSEGAEFYAKWIFSADGTFQYYLVNTSQQPMPFGISGGYEVGTYMLGSGPVDAIYFTEHASATYPFDYGVFNFRMNSPNQICIGDRVGGLGPQWNCFNRASP